MRIPNVLLILLATLGIAHAQYNPHPVIILKPNHNNSILKESQLRWQQVQRQIQVDGIYIDQKLSANIRDTADLSKIQPPFSGFEPNYPFLEKLPEGSHFENQYRHAVWITCFNIKNPSSNHKSVFVRLPNGLHADLFTMIEPSGSETHTTDGISINAVNRFYNGRWVPMNLLRIKHFQNYHQISIAPNRTLICVARLQPWYSINQQMPFNIVVESDQHFTKINIRRHLWQGIFLGFIMVIAFYNIFFFLVVKDKSYLIFVLHIIGIGLYFAYYYGFGIEYLWPESQQWDTWCYSLILPFASLAQLWFTKTYLNTPINLPVLNRIINILIVLTFCLFIIGFHSYNEQIDLLAPLFITNEILYTFIQVVMLVAGIMMYRKNYTLPEYFIYANLLIVTGALAFMLRELGYLPEVWFTRYFIQVGIVIQLLLFALGLASRFKQKISERSTHLLEKGRNARIDKSNSAG